MKSLKLIAVVGLAVVLVSWLVMPTGAQVGIKEITIEISGAAQACDFTTRINDKEAKVTLTGKETIRQVRDLTVQKINELGVPGVTATPLPADNQFVVTKVESFEIVPLGASREPLAKVGDTAKACGLTFTVIAVRQLPTLTEWGLIALAVLLAGGMAYMLYRRRPALRPAAP